LRLISPLSVSLTIGREVNVGDDLPSQSLDWCKKNPQTKDNYNQDQHKQPKQPRNKNY